MRQAEQSALLEESFEIFFVAKARTIPRLVLMTVTLVQVSKILT